MAEKKTLLQSLLIEIGTEEIPANYLAYADLERQEFLRSRFLQAFEAINDPRSFEMGELEIYLTPRRMVFYLPRVRFNARAQKETVAGPPKDKAYDARGKPTPMLEGFCRSKGIGTGDIQVLQIKGKECVGFIKRVKPRPLERRAQELLRGFADRLTFPKLMIWDDSGFKFPRPVRSLLCLVDDRPVKVRLGGLVSGVKIRLFSAGRRKTAAVSGARGYFRVLKSHGVIWDQAKRRAKIEEALRMLTRQCGGHYAAQAGLLDEVTFLTENPVCLAGKFDQTYANLPAEVLTSSLSKSQRLFSVRNKKGAHLPFFVAVLDGRPRECPKVLGTIAAVLKAKLQDSRFFFDEDMKLYGTGGGAPGSSEGVGKLKREFERLLFLKGAGSMAQKTVRMAEAGEALSDGWGLNADERKVLAEAVSLAKTDLLTHMVGEFPELQGTIGGCYLRTAAGNRMGPVAQAVAEHYLPVSPEGVLPSTRAGGALSILDKADLIVACFAMGKVPSSSQDPYALKRSLTGILRIVSETGINVRWQPLCKKLLSLLREQKTGPKIDEAGCLERLRAFYGERAFQFYEAKGFDRDMVEAVLASAPDDMRDAADRLKSLSGIRKRPAFVRAVKILERTTNILKGAEGFTPSAVRSDLIETGEEKALWGRLTEAEARIRKTAADADYVNATNLYADAFFDILHAFFDKVLVNVEDPEVRQNRLSLLSAVRSVYADGVADLSRIRIEAD